LYSILTSGFFAVSGLIVERMSTFELERDKLKTF
jgi:hypothetical protein